MTDFTRRDALALAGSAAAFTLLPALPVSAMAEDAIAEFTGGAAVTEGGVDLTAPEIAENGNTVPLEVAAAGATAILVVATANPNPKVAEFTFGALGAPRAATRIRLAGTQDVIAIAKMPDGAFKMARRNVNVTIGGCGS